MYINFLLFFLSYLQYLWLVKEKGVQEWLFEECRQIASIKFNVKDIEHAHHCVSSLAECLHVSINPKMTASPYIGPAIMLM